MSSGVNHVILVGHLGADPELKTTASGKQVAEFRMATSRRWNDAHGQSQESTEWHRVKVWGRMAESVGRFLHKGRQVYVEGRIESHKWVDKEGHDRRAYDIVARQVVFLGGGRAGQRAFGEEGRATFTGMTAAPDEMDVDIETEEEREPMGHLGASASSRDEAWSPYRPAQAARP